VDAVGGKVEVYVDGGIRRGTDVLKAIACAVRALCSSDALSYGDWLPVPTPASGMFWKCCVRNSIWPWRFPAAQR